jgi:hypothetical protein
MKTTEELQEELQDAISVVSKIEAQYADARDQALRYVDDKFMRALASARACMEYLSAELEASREIRCISRLFEGLVLDLDRTREDQCRLLEPKERAQLVRLLEKMNGDDDGGS